MAFPKTAPTLVGAIAFLSRVMEYTFLQFADEVASNAIYYESGVSPDKVKASDRVKVAAVIYGVREFFTPLLTANTTLQELADMVHQEIVRAEWSVEDSGLLALISRKVHEMESGVRIATDDTPNLDELVPYEDLWHRIKHWDRAIMQHYLMSFHVEMMGIQHPGLHQEETQKAYFARETE